jgi:hypothetical protein
MQGENPYKMWFFGVFEVDLVVVSSSGYFLLHCRRICGGLLPVAILTVCCYLRWAGV